MQWDDTGFLISKNKYSENSVIAEIYTLNHGKCSGVIYGGTSRKMKNYLQLGNKIFVNYKSKNENKIGYFNIEIIEAISPYFFDNKLKTLILVSSVNVLKILTPELQKNINIYNLFLNLLTYLKDEKRNIILDYVYWELDFLKEIGFDLDLNKLNFKNINGKEFINIFIDDENYNLPTFILNRSYSNVKEKHIFQALNFIGNYIQTKILKPNNLLYPKFRYNLQNLYK